MPTDSDTGFATIAIATKTGPVQVIAERTTSPHLVIHPDAKNEAGFAAFGNWAITHVPTGMSIPTNHGHDVDTIRWIASQIAESDVDLTLPVAELTAALSPLVRRLLEEATTAEQESMPPGEIAPSVLDKICATNRRVLAEES